ncbi:p21-C-terminal region-binding protein-domain-containing protein [Neohortaea acidophila]|uniref:Protein BCP1 n=1 Tax=Neohortaea acidophila TaxID=245834 RepID=A0A6A6PT25_9PEZI|nr:p21-C-terminal region-binding protein-domain-containing protein [Neohortaea acidophila]KAF2483132.1 p21-C-terminal region-binding protein-domain-containing protein [Neohortaea acidophila]
MEVDADDSGSEDDTSVLDVDFEYFNPSPEIDFQGLKTLLRQLFDVDNQLFDLSELADMILAQPLLGTMIKCDGEDSDPYAFLTVLNMHVHRGKAVMQQLSQYLSQRVADHAGMRDSLAKLLDAGDGKAQVGLVLAERVINMPHQTVPPMYTMLLEEMQWANEEKEPYQFTHYLVVSKTYTEVASKLDAEDDRPSKKSKKAAAGGSQSETLYFHPEDEVLARHALASCNFDYVKAEEGASDSKRAFQELGVQPQGHLILIEAGKFEAAVKAVGVYLGAEAAS